jgi:hypothetical protein
MTWNEGRRGVLTPRTVWKRGHIGESPRVGGDMGGKEVKVRAAEWRPSLDIHSPGCGPANGKQRCAQSAQIRRG